MSAVEAEAVLANSAWWKRRWFQNAALLSIALVGVYGFVYWDVITRSRQAYEEAEKYMDWNAHPEKKKEALENEFNQEKKKIDLQLEKNKISKEDYRTKLDALEFDKEYALNESSLKYAYQWYKDTYELFSPPESRWVRLARQKAPQALELWKEELRQQNVPFEDYMFE